VLSDVEFLQRATQAAWFLVQLMNTVVCWLGRQNFSSSSESFSLCGHWQSKTSIARSTVL